MKYKIIYLGSFGSNRIEYHNSWIICKLKMIWLNITGKSAVWMEDVKYKK